MKYVYNFKDGAKIELTETENDYILTEYSDSGEKITCSLPNGYGIEEYTEEHYSKDSFSLGEIITIVKEEYGINEELQEE